LLPNESAIAAVKYSAYYAETFAKCARLGLCGISKQKLFISMAGRGADEGEMPEETVGLRIQIVNAVEVLQVPNCRPALVCHGIILTRQTGDFTMLGAPPSLPGRCFVTLKGNAGSKVEGP
jgi:hypothetical protein